MTIPKDLLSEIETALGPVISPSLTSASNVSDLFEAYIFSVILNAASTEGAKITYRDINGNDPKKFVFRTSPGYIYSTRHPYTHAVISFPSKPVLEAHLGVRVVGKSNVLHECDVAVMQQIEAETCRMKNVSPRSSKILIAVECKFYSTPLQLGLARSFIGLTLDLSATQPLFVSNNSSQSVEKLLSARNRGWEHNIIPSSSVDVVRLKSTFQTTFKNFQAKFS